MHNFFAFFITLLVSTSLTVGAAAVPRANEQVLVVPIHYDDKKNPVPDLHAYSPRWNFCITWQAIWQHARVKIDQMDFIAGGLGPMYIIEFHKDNQCKQPVGYISPDITTRVAMTAQGKNTVKELQTADGTRSYPANVAKDMQAFKVRFVCANGDFSTTEDHSDCNAKGGTAIGDY